MANITELIFQFKGDPSNLKSVMSQVRSELSQAAQATKATNQGELSMRQQLSAAAALQRQRSAALLSQWRQQERQASQLARGVQPVATNLQRITDVMQTLARSTAAVQGPLGGIAGRLSSLGSIASEAGGKLGLIGVGIGALVVAASAATVAIFKLTQQAAEFQGKMFDLSQQVGISVETLSALEILATTTGGSIDSITASLGIFQRNLEDAQDPTSKEAKLLKELGVSARDTESALRQTLTRLAAMPEGFQQTALALELFGRGGKQILAILKEMDGDLDGAIKKFREMGILIGTDSAKAADKFNDQLAILHFQIRALAGMIGNEAMPEIQAAIQLASQLVAENQGVIRSWIGDIGDAARGALILADAIRTIGGAVTGLGRIPIPQILQILGNISGATGILRGLTALGDRGPFAGVVAGAGAVRPEGGGVRRPSGGRGGGGRAPRDTFLSDAFKAAELTEREALQAIQADIEENKRALDQQIRDIEDFTTRAVELANQRLQAEITSLNAQEAALIQALNQRRIKAEEFDTKLRELESERTKVRQANTQEIFKLESDRDRQVSRAHIAAKQRELQIAEEADQRQIARIESRIQREVIAESEGERQIAAIIEEGFRRRKEVLEDEETQYGVTLERRKDITSELIRLEGERAKAAEDASQRILDAWNREQAAEAGRGAEGATRRRRALGAGQEGFLFGINTGQLAELERGVQSFADVAEVSFSAVGAAVNGLAQGVGALVQQWVLMGNQADLSLKKVTASVLSSVSAQAAVQAVMFLAYGIASLTPWGAAIFGPAAPWFKAAALMGSIAVIAGGIGRAVAGNSFAGGGEGATTGPQQPREEERDRTIREGRTGGRTEFSRERIVVVEKQVIIKPPEGWIMEEFKGGYRRSVNGVRDLLRNDLLGEATG